MKGLKSVIAISSLALVLAACGTDDADEVEKKEEAPKQEEVDQKEEQKEEDASIEAEAAEKEDENAMKKDDEVSKSSVEDEERAFHDDRTKHLLKTWEQLEKDEKVAMKNDNGYPTQIVTLEEQSMFAGVPVDVYYHLTDEFQVAELLETSPRYMELRDKYGVGFIDKEEVPEDVLAVDEEVDQAPFSYIGTDQPIVVSVTYKYDSKDKEYMKEQLETKYGEMNSPTYGWVTENYHIWHDEELQSVVYTALVEDLFEKVPNFEERSYYEQLLGL